MNKQTTSEIGNELDLFTLEIIDLIADKGGRSDTREIKRELGVDKSSKVTYRYDKLRKQDDDERLVEPTWEDIGNDDSDEGLLTTYFPDDWDGEGRQPAKICELTERGRLFAAEFDFDSVMSRMDSGKSLSERERFEQFDRDLSRLENRVESLSSPGENQGESVDESDTEPTPNSDASTEGVPDEIDERISSIEEEWSEADETLGEFANRIKSLREDVDDLQSDVGAIKRALEGANMNLDDYRN